MRNIRWPSPGFACVSRRRLCDGIVILSGVDATQRTGPAGQPAVFAGGRRRSERLSRPRLLSRRDGQAGRRLWRPLTEPSPRVAKKLAAILARKYRLELRGIRAADDEAVSSDLDAGRGHHRLGDRLHDGQARSGFETARVCQIIYRTRVKLTDDRYHRILAAGDCQSVAGRPLLVPSEDPGMKLNTPQVESGLNEAADDCVDRLRHELFGIYGELPPKSARLHRPAPMNLPAPHRIRSSRRPARSGRRCGSFAPMAELLLSGSEKKGPTPSRKWGAKWNREGDVDVQRRHGDAGRYCSSTFAARPRPPRTHSDTRLPSAAL